MRVAVVGPTHPYKGGVAAHTTDLAHHLAAAGHETDLVSWSYLYPARLYPGEQAVPDGAPDTAPYARTTRPLSWARPESWYRVGRRLRGYDLVVLVHVVPAVVPAHLVLLRALGRRGRRGPRVAVIAHNVLPHESHPGASTLVRTLLTRCDVTVTHTVDQARLAREHGAHEVRIVSLAPHLPGGPPVAREPSDGPPRLLALGMVRAYKGIDLLVQALAQVPDVTLTVAGELWGAAGETVRELASRPELGGRVDVVGGYLPSTALPGLLARHDVMALPYRSATASQNAMLGFTHGLPVLVTRVGVFPEQVTDGVDGLVVEPGSVDALVAGLRRLCEPGVVESLRVNVRPPDFDGPWALYVDALTAEPGAAPPVASEPVASEPAGSQPVAPQMVVPQVVAPQVVTAEPGG